MFKRVLRKLKLFMINPRSAIFMISGTFYNLSNYLIKQIFHSRRVKCNICGWQGYRFSAIVSANYVRYNAICPACYSAERNRALVEYMNESGLFARNGLKCLDIGPVQSFRAYFELKGCDYISIDISGSAMIKMDATQLEFSDSTFDLIICSHVLEHVKNDIQAIKEMFRVLKSDGICYIMVPWSRNRVNTIEYEEQNLLDPGHVRTYGLDFMDRIKSAGFKVGEIDLLLTLDKNNVSRYGLGTAQSCFLCTKNAATIRDS